MAQIAAAAGMSVGHIYRYFANKEAVIAAIVEQGVAQKMEHIAAVEIAARHNGQDLAAASAAVARPGGLTDIDRSEAALMLEIVAEAARNPVVACILERNDRMLRERSERVVAGARPHWPTERVRSVVQVLAALREGWYLRVIADPNAFGSGAEQLRSDLITRALQD